MNLMKTSFVALSLALVGAPAMAQQNGLVNVTIVDLLDVNGVAVNVQIPVAIAANVCNVQVAVLAQDVGQGDANCDATAESVADNKQAVNVLQRQGITLPAN